MRYLVNKKILHLFVVMTIVISLALGQTVSAEPVERCYGASHAEIHYSTPHHNMYVLPLYVYSNANSVHTILDSHGYSNPDNTAYANRDAFSVREDLEDDAICFIHSHAGPGHMFLPYFDAANMDYDVAYLTGHGANGHQDPQCAGIGSYYLYVGDLETVRFIWFGGCETAITSLNTEEGWGNLLTEAVSLGVDCSVGFEGDITTAHHSYFAERFMTYAMNSSNTVSTALGYAKADTYSSFGSYGAVDTYDIRGQSWERLAPAAYGN